MFSFKKPDWHLNFQIKKAGLFERIGALVGVFTIGAIAVLSLVSAGQNNFGAPNFMLLATVVWLGASLLHKIITLVTWRNVSFLSWLAIGAFLAIILYDVILNIHIELALAIRIATAVVVSLDYLSGFSGRFVPKPAPEVK